MNVNNKENKRPILSPARFNVPPAPSLSKSVSHSTFSSEFSSQSLLKRKTAFATEADSNNTTDDDHNRFPSLQRPYRGYYLAQPAFGSLNAQYQNNNYSKKFY